MRNTLISISLSKRGNRFLNRFLFIFYLKFQIFTLSNALQKVEMLHLKNIQYKKILIHNFFPNLHKVSVKIINLKEIINEHFFSAIFHSESCDFKFTANAHNPSATPK